MGGAAPDERQRAGSTAISPGPHCERAAPPERTGGPETERHEVRTGRGEKKKGRRKEENSHLRRCLMPAVRLCNYSPLSLACLYSLSSSSSFSLPSSLPLFFYIPLFALFLLICANHHETTATLEPLTGTAWHPAPSKRIIAGTHTHFQVLCASSNSLNSQLRRFGIYYGREWRVGWGRGGFFIPAKLPRVIVAPNKLQRC